MASFEERLRLLNEKKPGSKSFSHGVRPRRPSLLPENFGGTGAGVSAFWDAALALDAPIKIKRAQSTSSTAAVVAKDHENQEPARVANLTVKIAAPTTTSAPSPRTELSRWRDHLRESNSTVPDAVIEEELDEDSEKDGDGEGNEDEDEAEDRDDEGVTLQSNSLSRRLQGISLDALPLPEDDLESDVPIRLAENHAGNVALAKIQTMPNALFLEIVKSILKRWIMQGDEACDAGKDSVFYLAEAPPISLSDYIDRIARYAPFERGTALAALNFVRRACDLSWDSSPESRNQTDRSSGFQLSGQTAHRLVLTCFLLASKSNSDFQYKANRWGKVGGVETEELVTLEQELLGLLSKSTTGSKAPQATSAAGCTRPVKILTNLGHGIFISALEMEQVGEAFLKFQATMT